MNQRPVAVTIAGCLYIAVGAIGFAYHITDFNPQHPFQNDVLWVELFRLTAIVCGVYLFRRRNWARWLALAWMGYHVILSVFHSISQLAVHLLFLAIVVYLLFSPAPARYFRAAER